LPADAAFTFLFTENPTEKPEKKHGFNNRCHNVTSIHKRSHLLTNRFLNYGIPPYSGLRLPGTEMSRPNRKGNSSIRRKCSLRMIEKGWREGITGSS
jgi:hypothetical protein